VDNAHKKLGHSFKSICYHVWWTDAL